MNKKLKIAVTGGIGGGKSSFCNYIAGKGFTVLNADEMSKEILVKNTAVKSEIIKAFGAGVYDRGKLNKKFLAEKVFSNPASVKKINSVVHPVVISQINREMKAALKSGDIVFVEAALIYEAKMEDLFDYVVVITADEKVRKKRAAANGLTAKEFEKRKENQIPEDKKRKKADFVFENNGSLEDLYIRAEILLKLVS